MQYQIEMIRTGGVISKDSPHPPYVYKLLLSGNFVMEISEDFTHLLTTFIKGGARKVIFDLADLRYIDSTGIGIFINLTKLMRGQGGDMVMYNVNPKILEVFNLVKLQEFIQIFKGEKQALEYLSTLGKR